MAAESYNLQAMSCRAFSLVELAVALTIAMVMAALLLPTAFKAMESSRRSQCMGNMRQIGVALFAYASEHNNHLPPVSSVWPPGEDRKEVWSYALWTYAGYDEASYKPPENDLQLKAGAKKANIFRCPSTRAHPTAVPSVATGVNSNLSSYGLNSRPAGGAGDYDTMTRPIPVSRCVKPSRTAMVVESSFFAGDFGCYFTWFGLLPHSNGSNILFFDGHVEWMPLDAIPRDESGDGTIFWDGYNYWGN